MSLSADVVVARDGFTLDVRLAVAAGEVVAVLGPNGAGKTTLLRALAGLDTLSSGVVRLGGAVLSDTVARVGVATPRRGVAMVFQDHRLFPHLSARDNIAFGPRSTGTARRVAESMADEWLDRMQLSALAARRPGQLSGGQAQRVALARALITGPGLLVLDEPLAALDPSGRDEVRAQLRRELARFGGATLVVTHDLLDAVSLADRVLVIEDGRVVQDDAPAQLMRRPLTRYVARAVGRNLLRGRAARGLLEIDPADGGGRLPAAAGLSGPAFAAIAPGAVSVLPVGAPPGSPSPPETVHQPPPSETAWQWNARIGSVEPHGDRVRVHLAGAPSLVAEITLTEAANLDLSRGQPVVASVGEGQVESYPVPD